MNINRRKFLTYSGLLLGTGIFGGYSFESLADLARAGAANLIVGTDKKVCSINLKTLEETTLDISFRAHSFLQHPQHANRFWTIEKWGRFAAEIDLSSKSVLFQLKSPKNTQFGGHGFFSPKGDVLFITVVDFTTGQGYLAGYDVTHYKLITKVQITAGTLHDCHVQQDGTIIAASSGLKMVKYTKATSGPRIEPASVVRFNLHNNTVIDKYEIADSGQSISHLTATNDGSIFALSVQTENSKSQSGNIYFLKSGGKNLNEVELPELVKQALIGEMLSIAIDEANQTAVITNPTGHTLVFVDTVTGKYLTHLTGQSFSNVSFDQIQKRFVAGGMSMAAIDAREKVINPLHIKNPHVADKKSKHSGLLNGSHSFIV